MIGHHHLALNTAWYCTSDVTIERQVTVKEVSWTFSVSCELDNSRFDNDFRSGHDLLLFS